MPTTSIALFQAPATGAQEAVQKPLRSLEAASSPETVIGTQVQDPNIILLTSEASNFEDQPLFRAIKDLCGQPTSSYQVDLEESALGPGGAASAPYVEFVANYFPVSRLTPDFRAQVEADFAKFNGICKSIAHGDLGLSTGWSVDEVDHQDVTDEKTKVFLIMRGWRSMEDFENITKHEKFESEAIPILLAWKAPFKMVSSVTSIAFGCLLISGSGTSSGGPKSKKGTIRFAVHA